MSSPLLETLRRSLSGQFDVECELGGGGMAHVFLARERALGRQVVLKVLPPDAVGGVSVDRFKREVQVAARLQHPHIVPLLSAGEVDGVPYYTMPFIEGESLRARIGREHELPVATAVRLLRDVADALVYAHAHDVVHRDIKPDNVLLTGQHAVVTDFGIAKAIASARSGTPRAVESITQFGVAIGTPAYMAPEQASADPHVDHRADVYAIGALGYELLTGQPPFSGHSPQALLAAVIGKDPQPIDTVRPSVPAPLAHLLMRCLEKRPADRPQTAAEVLQVLEAQVTPSGTAAAMANISARRGPRYWLVASAVAVLAVAGTAGVMLMRQTPVASSVSVISVMPFVPTSADTALSRLGRDLVTTISANLDGVGAIRATDPFATLSRSGSSGTSVDAAAALARKVGAGSFVMGSLLREAGRVRADFSLYPADGAEPLARGSVVAPIDSVSALSDSLTWSLLRQVWRRDHPPTPSVAGLTTKSMVALRAYLEGERARGEGRFPDAIASFDRAIEADSTFWLAYLRNVSTRNWMFYPVDSVLRRYREHEDELPERDRAVLAAGRARGISNQIAAFHQVAARFPDAWTAWEGSGDILWHDGPLIGLPLERSRADLERVVALNPRWAEAWQHLLFVSIRTEGNSGAGVDSITRILRSIGYDSASAQVLGFSELQSYALVRRLLADPSAIRSPLADSVIAGMKRARMSDLLAAINPSFPLLFSGGGEANIAISQRALAAGLTERDAAGHRAAIVWAWASRGAYDSALAVAERYAAASRGPGPTVDLMRVAALAEFGGAVPGAFESRWNRVERSFPGQSANQRAEVTWLRGALAALRRDTATLASASSALTRLAADSTARFARVLQRELAAFRVEVSGDPVRAADSIAALEYEIAENEQHGFQTALARGAASRWLQAAGRSADAERLLIWEEHFTPNRPLWSAKLMFQPLVMLERGRLAEARGDVVEARRFYTDFLARYDRPMKAHEPLVAEARAALDRLSRINRGS